ncbi:hypothetical protein LINPERPRIM_LOCUS30864 [Linum perenne]
MMKKRKLQTLTSTLTIASKLTSIGTTYKPKQDTVFNIDAPDVDNHLAITEYVE